MTLLKTLPKEEHPIERLKRLSASKLEERELLALLLVEGDRKRKRDALELAGDILKQTNGIQGLDRLSFFEQSRLSGMTPTKAARLSAALEFGKRLAKQSGERGEKLDDAKSVFSRYAPTLSGRRNEVFLALLLDGRLRFQKDIQLAEGGFLSTTIEPIELFGTLIKEKPAAVIFIHNHPSGNTDPSKDDIELTKRLLAGGKLLGLRVLDHVIIGAKGYFSFAEAGMLEIEAKPSRKKRGKKKQGGFSTGEASPLLGEDTGFLHPDMACIHTAEDLLSIALEGKMKG